MKQVGKTDPASISTPETMGIIIGDLGYIGSNSYIPIEKRVDN